jgi:hypothetical protein
VNDFAEIRQQLYDRAAARKWRGIDPYDGLTSPLACLLPGKLARQGWTQLHRRSRINLRSLCGIRPQLNSTTVALFALGSGAEKLRELLRGMQNPDGGWGYPFPWQSRAFFAPANTSNLICTYWAAKALHGCHPERSEGSQSLPREAEILRSAQNDNVVGMAREFITKNLLRDGWITYIAGSDTQVHNINLLGAALLGREDCAEWSVRRQRADGSWPYGEAANQQWVDNFHTGYCLVALRETGWFTEAAARGFEFWDRHFWSADFAPRYYADGSGPVDIHCCAQGILTYLAFGEREKAARVAEWAVKNMWDSRGYFWYQRGNRINYLRWSQAWMYCALSKLLQAQ